MPQLGQHLPALVLEATAPHLLPRQDEKPRLVIERPAGLRIPLVPSVDALPDQPGVEGVRAVLGADDLADVGGAGVGMGKGPRVQECHGVPAGP